MRAIFLLDYFLEDFFEQRLLEHFLEHFLEKDLETFGTMKPLCVSVAFFVSVIVIAVCYCHCSLRACWPGNSVANNQQVPSTHPHDQLVVVDFKEDKTQDYCRL